MNADLLPQQMPTAIDLAHTPELAILIALDTLLEMTAVTIQLSLPELDLVRCCQELPDHDLDDRDLVVAKDILDLIGALSRTIRVYRDLALRT